MTTDTSRAGYHSVTPRLVVSDPIAQVEFLNRHLTPPANSQHGRLAELRSGDSLIMISETTERDAFSAFLYIYVADADEAFDRAIRPGATSVEAPFDTLAGIEEAWCETLS